MRVKDSLFETLILMFKGATPLTAYHAATSEHGARKSGPEKT
jgi:hypothetical protein